MKTIYQLQDKAGRLLNATYENGELKVIMTFYPEEGLTLEECCEKLGWSIVDREEIEKPKILPFKRKES